MRKPIIDKVVAISSYIRIVDGEGIARSPENAAYTKYIKPKIANKAYIMVSNLFDFLISEAQFIILMKEDLYGLIKQHAQILH